MNSIWLPFFAFVLAPHVWAAEPASYFKGKYEVVSKDVKIDTFPKGSDPTGPADLAQTTEFEITKTRYGYAVYVDSYDYPLTIFANKNLSLNGNIHIETYTGNSTKAVSVTKIRDRFHPGDHSNIDNRVVLQKTTDGVSVTYTYLEDDLWCKAAKCDPFKTDYKAQFVLRKKP